MSMFNDISWGSKDDKKECKSNAQLVSLYAKRFRTKQWSFLGLGSEKGGILSVKTLHKVNGTRLLRKWCWHSQKADTQFSEPRVHCPEECYTSVPMEKRLKLFRTIISVNQLSIYGAVSDLCEEYSICQTSTGRPVVKEQSNPLFVPSVIKSNKLLNDDFAQDAYLLRRYQERIEKVITTRSCD